MPRKSAEAAQQRPTREIFTESARECCKNAKRLLSDAVMVEFEKPKSTYYFLAMIAQEETAKAFLLYLVSIEAIPWTPFLLRATCDHKCKHLVGIVLDYLAPDFDKWMAEMELRIKQKLPPTFPKPVADALNILYHEKIRKWERSNWFWAEDPVYDKATLKIAEGGRDKAKQQGLYVDLGRSGQVSSSPDHITEAQADAEFQTAERYLRCVTGIIDRENQPRDLEEIARLFKALFNGNVFIES